MLVNIYTIYDNMAEECGPIFQAKNDKVACRACDSMISEACGTSVSDYQLLVLGGNTKKNSMIMRTAVCIAIFSTGIIFDFPFILIQILAKTFKEQSQIARNKRAVRRKKIIIISQSDKGCIFPKLGLMKQPNSPLTCPSNTASQTVTTGNFQPLRTNIFERLLELEPIGILDSHRASTLHKEPHIRIPPRERL